MSQKHNILRQVSKDTTTPKTSSLKSITYYFEYTPRNHDRCRTKLTYPSFHTIGRTNLKVTEDAPLSRPDHPCLLRKMLRSLLLLYPSDTGSWCYTPNRALRTGVSPPPNCAARSAEQYRRIFSGRTNQRPWSGAISLHM